MGSNDDSTPNPHRENKPPNKFGPQSKKLASIIRGFKSAVTKDSRIINAVFAWQSRYHDHIIRNEKTFQTIVNYIQNNPIKWQEDNFIGIKIHDLKRNFRI